MVAIVLVGVSVALPTRSVDAGQLRERSWHVCWRLCHGDKAGLFFGGRRSATRVMRS
jgi:hypothetical protein